MRESIKVYNENSGEFEVDFKNEEKKGRDEVNNKTGLSISCTPIIIFNRKYKDKSIKAIIANTFPSQALPNAYDKMAEYGKFCYDEYTK